MGDVAPILHSFPAVSDAMALSLHPLPAVSYAMAFSLHPLSNATPTLYPLPAVDDAALSLQPRLGGQRMNSHSLVTRPWRYHLLVVMGVVMVRRHRGREGAEQGLPTLEAGRVLLECGLHEIAQRTNA